MIKFEHAEVVGWEHAIRGMRNPMNSWGRSDSGNNVITLCGSSKFKDEFIKVQKELSLKGYLVLSLGLFGHSGDEEAWEKKDLLDKVHTQKIDISSSVFVIDVGGYIGESTRREIDYARCYGKKVYYYSHNDLENIQPAEASFIGPNDHDLMMRLAKGGPVHAKYRRMITVYVDITAPLYWWKEFDTYKVGTVSNSCSTMHKIADKEFTLEDFSHEHLINGEIFSYPLGGGWRGLSPIEILKANIELLNNARKYYLSMKEQKVPYANEKAKEIWWQMIQLLPSSYNQKRTIMLNYEVLANIYKSRKDHKLDEWRTFCSWIEELPYSEVIIGKYLDTDKPSEEANDELNSFANYLKNGTGVKDPIIDKLVYIREKSYRPSQFEMLAEESVELAHVAQKMARWLRDNQPVSEDFDFYKAYDNLIEEFADVLLSGYVAIDVFNEDRTPTDKCCSINEIFREKAYRWVKRLEKKNGGHAE